MNICKRNPIFAFNCEKNATIKTFADSILEECENKGFTVKDVEYLINALEDKVSDNVRNSDFKHTNSDC